MMTHILLLGRADYKVFINIVILVLSLGIILLGCELFTNGIEWLGKKLKLGDGVVGSIFSAVGTCLPETLIPIIALLFSNKTADTKDIGIGAIVGAPFMLSTLAFFITGISVIIFSKRRRTALKININAKILSRDISFFIVAYLTAIFTSFLPSYSLKLVMAILLFVFYVFYVMKTVNSDTTSSEIVEDLILAKILKAEPKIIIIAFQVLAALAVIIMGAEFFVGNMEVVAKGLGVSTLALSIIITPIATELPEKFNSIIWISKNKDTLALGNVTGAMVFQSCIPVAIGIMATDWVLDTITLFSAIMALGSAAVVFLWLKINKSISWIPLVIGGIFYITFISFLILRGFK